MQARALALALARGLVRVSVLALAVVWGQGSALEMVAVLAQRLAPVMAQQSGNVTEPGEGLEWALAMAQVSAEEPCAASVLALALVWARMLALVLGLMSAAAMDVA